MNRLIAHHSNYQSSKGFTLLEMMLVIAIIAAITVLGLSGWDQMIMNRKIQQASLEMQMWMQAGLKYYSENGQFPNSAQDIVTAGLMPDSSLQNPWSVNSSGVYNVSVDPNNNSLLLITTTIPSDTPYSTSIAKMLAGNLPFGTSSGSVVSMDIVPPIDIASSNDIITSIVQINSDGPNNPIPKPNCQTGFSPQIYVALSAINTVAANGQAYMLQSASIQTNATATAWQPTVNVVIGGQAAPPGSGGAVAIITCEKNPVVSQGNNHNNHANYVF